MSGPPPLYHHGQHAAPTPNTPVATPTGHPVATPTGPPIVPSPGQAMVTSTVHPLQRHHVAMPTGQSVATPTGHPVATPTGIPGHTVLTPAGSQRIVGVSTVGGAYYPQHMGYNGDLIQQTNERLATFRHHLSNPSAFANVVRALLDWIVNPRSFISQCESSLMACLDVVYRVAASPGYDLELGYRLLNSCVLNRHVLSEKAAMLVTRWHDDFNKVLLSRQQRMMGVTMPHPQVYISDPPPQGNYSDPSYSPQQNYGQQGNSQPSVSVVTAVWNMPQGGGYQSGPSPMSSNPHPFQRNTPVGTYPSGTLSYTPTSTHAGTPGMAGQQQQQQQQPQQQQQQQNQAHIVAQAIVATATATVTATAKVPKDPPQRGQGEMMNGISPQNVPQSTPQNVPPHAPQSLPQNVPPNQVIQHPSPVPGPSPVGHTPLPGGQPPPFHQYQASNQPPNMLQQPPPHSRPDTLPLRGHQQPPPPDQMYQTTPTHPQQPDQIYQTTPTHPQPPDQIYQSTPAHQQAPPPDHMYQTTPTHQPMMTPSLASPVLRSPYSHHPPPNMVAYTQMPPSNQHHPGHERCVPSPIDHHNMYSAISPAVNVANHISASPVPMDGGYYPKDPHQMLRLTFPLKDNTLLRPFKLPHGIPHTEHPFQLNEKIYPVLLERFDLEIQLNCYHDNDRQELCNWPLGVSVLVNNKPVQIERRNTLHRPLHIKRLCQAGHNLLRISATQCCCSHYFVLQLVHRPSVKSLLSNLLQQRKLPESVCKEKMRKVFAGNDDSVLQTSTNITLKCPITYRRINIPARGSGCQHIQCFDLESYLQMNCDRSAWKCPVCGQLAILQGLEIDCYLWIILNKLKTRSDEVEEVTFDQDANWLPVNKPPSPDDDSDDLPQVKKQKPSSPSSLSTTRSQFKSERSTLSPPSSNAPHLGNTSRDALTNMQSLMPYQTLSGGPPKSSSNEGIVNGPVHTGHYIPSQSHTPSQLSQSHTPSQLSQSHTPSQPSQIHTPSQPSQIHTPSQTSQIHTPSQTSQIHTPSQPSQIHTPSQPSQPHLSSQSPVRSQAQTPSQPPSVEHYHGNTFGQEEDNDISAFLESLPDANDLLQALGSSLGQDLLT